MIVSKEETITCIGGGKITAALLNAAATLIKTIYGMGQNLGSTISRWISGISC